ncbi:MAG: tubulin-like doman-containing protein [Prevotella sp.]
MANHLLIGLGGTGGKILRAMRKRIYEEFGTNTPDIDTHISYIYVDSDLKDLKDDASWNYMGNPVYLSPSEKVNIHGIGGGVLQNLNSYPGIKAFVSEDDRKLMQDDQVSAIIDAGIGGQRRRFGRILLANNITNDPNNGFAAVLAQRIIDITNSQGDGKVTFHICAGLAGGTGSGSIVDAIAQLHKIVAPMGKAFDTFLYLYVPEILVEQDVNVKGFYHGNGYAALQEINAIALGKYQPVDISGQMDNRTGKVRRLIDGLNADAFKRAYLFTNTNEINQVLSKKDKLPASVADFLYQRIVSGETEGGQLGRISELENAGTPPEKDASNQNVHARNFATFGIKRIEYPESEIKAYATEKSVWMTILGIIYNNWVQNRGFASDTDEHAGIGYTQEVHQPDTLEKLWLDDRYLTLQTPVEKFAGTEEWESYDTYWEKFCEFFAGDTLEIEKDRRLWPTRFLDACEAEFKNNFRGNGVVNFFNNMGGQREVNRYASVLCRHIEETLFKEWVNGNHGENKTMSLQKIRLYLGELIAATRERITDIAKIQSNLVGKKEANFNECNILKHRLEDTGFLSNLLFDTAKKYFMQYTTQMSKDYAYQTKLLGYEFAQILLEEVVSRLGEMQKSVTLLENMLRQAVEDANTSAEIACSPSGANATGEVEVTDKRYDPEVVCNEVERILLSDSDLQENSRTATMEGFKKIAYESGKNVLFKTIYDTLGGGALIEEKNGKTKENTRAMIDFISKQSQPFVYAKMLKIAEEDETRKLLGVNILERIKQECPTDVLLDKYLEGVVASLKTFLPFNQAEFGRVPAGQKVERMAQGVQICLPKYTDPTNFRQKFIEHFGNKFPNTIFGDDKSVAVNPKANQIVIITVNSGFPLRFVQNVSYLKEQYDNMISEHEVHGKINKVLLHSESLRDNQLPSLFEEEAGDIRKRMIITAIKAYVTPRLMERGEDEETGEETNEINVGTRMDEVIYQIGADFMKTVDKLCEDAMLRGKLADHIDNACDEAFPKLADKKKLAQIIEDFVFDVVLPLCGNNKRSPEFTEVKEVAKELISSLTK